MRPLTISASVVLLLACGDDDREETQSMPPVAPVASGEEAPPVNDPAPPAAPAAAPMTGETVEIVPRVSIGPVRMGMTRAEVEALGVLRPHPQYSAMTLPVTVYYDEAGRARSMEIAVRDVDGVRIGAVTIPRDADMASAAALLGNCGAVDAREGGNLLPCPDATLVLGIGSGSPDEMWIRTYRDGEGY